MTLGDWFIGAMAIQCAIAAGAYLNAGNLPYFLAFVGYTVANVGLLLASAK